MWGIPYFFSILTASLSGVVQIAVPMLKTNTKLTEWIFCSIYVIYITFISCISYLPVMFCIIWIEKFSRLCKEAGVKQSTQLSSKCIDYYKNMENSLGFFFLFFFSLCQFFLFIFLFLIIAVQIMRVRTLERVLATISLIFSVTSLILLVLSTTLAATDALKSLKDLVYPLQEHLKQGNFRYHSLNQLEDKTSWTLQIN